MVNEVMSVTAGTRAVNICPVRLPCGAPYPAVTSTQKNILQQESCKGP